MEPKSPSVVVSQKMTAGKRALAARSPVSRILRENGLAEPSSASKKRTPRKGVKSPTARKSEKNTRKSTDKDEVEHAQVNKVNAAAAPKKRKSKLAEGELPTPLEQETTESVKPPKTSLKNAETPKKRKSKAVKDRKTSESYKVASSDDKHDVDTMEEAKVETKKQKSKHTKRDNAASDTGKATVVKEASGPRKKQANNGTSKGTANETDEKEVTNRSSKASEKTDASNKSTSKKRKSKVATCGDGDTDGGAKKEDLKEESPAKRVRFSDVHEPAAISSGLDSLRAKRKSRKREAVRSGAKDKKEEAAASSDPTRVVYIGHIPHGFYERQMRSYFGQFGKVTQLRLSRSPRTGASRGFAFVEFEHAEVAAKAAEAMDGYMMHGRRLKASLMRGKLHPKTFAGSRRRFDRVDWAAKARSVTVKQSKQPAGVAKTNRAIKKNHSKRTQRLRELGLTYKMPEISC